MTDKALPLACNLAAIPPTQRALYDTQKSQLRAAIDKKEELPDGYVFHFASEPGLLVAIAEFIEGERQCCAFYAFTIEIAPDQGAVKLRITGPEAAKEFIREALAV